MLTSTLCELVEFCLAVVPFMLVVIELVGATGSAIIPLINKIHYDKVQKLLKFYMIKCLPPFKDDCGFGE